jgi:hypothetical protein
MSLSRVEISVRQFTYVYTTELQLTQIFVQFVGQMAVNNKGTPCYTKTKLFIFTY